MKMQWRLRNYHRGNRPFKKILGRCKIFFTLSATMLLLYVTIRAERGISVVPSFIQSRNWKETAPIPVESKMLISESRPVVQSRDRDTRASFNASSEVLDSETPTSASFEVSRDIENAPVIFEVDRDNTTSPASVEFDPDIEASSAILEVDPDMIKASSESSEVDLDMVKASSANFEVDPDTSTASSANFEVDPDTSRASSTSSEVDPETRVTSANATQADTCDGRRIFMYEMPAEFNKELARNCHNLTGWPTMCEDITNHGFGELEESMDPSTSVLQPPNSWYRTDQFNLEVIMHERLKAYPCLTTNSDAASMFYIPFYHTLDLIRNLYNWDDISSRDRLGQKFGEWLSAQEPWQRHHGHRHVLVLGRIYWDFCRSTGKSETWGSDLLTHHELTNVTKLLIERNPWKEDTIGIPYPTSFHPTCDADLVAWQARVRASERRQLVSVAGGLRTEKLTGGIRDAVFDQCANATQCHLLACTHALCAGNPETIIRMGLESVFCLQPPGDSPTRKGIFDSLQAGCIPVLFNKYQVEVQYLLHLPRNASDYSVVIPEDAVLNRQFDMVDHLSKISHQEIARMRDNIVELLPRLLYRNPSLTGEYSSPDAFDVSVDALFERFQAEEGEFHPTVR